MKLNTLTSFLCKRCCFHPAFNLIAALCLFAGVPSQTLACPPFRTDDPTPVDYNHGALYLSATYFDGVGNGTGSFPQVELYYGPLPNVEIHAIPRLSFNKTHAGPLTYGFGDLELGFKYRFINNEDSGFTMGTAPLVQVPTGDEQRQLGTGHTTFFLPLWMQKSWDAWTTYGGGGWWRNPGEGNKDFWFFGGVVQRDISKLVTVGAELFGQTKMTDDGDYEIGFNVGAILNLSETQHILFSVGRDLHGDNNFFTYVAYQYEIDFAKKKKQKPHPERQ